jgi:hypothetical protein
MKLSFALIALASGPAPSSKSLLARRNARTTQCLFTRNAWTNTERARMPAPRPQRRPTASVRASATPKLLESQRLAATSALTTPGQSIRSAWTRKAPARTSAAPPQRRHSTNVMPNAKLLIFQTILNKLLSQVIVNQQDQI